MINTSSITQTKILFFIGIVLLCFSPFSKGLAQQASNSAAQDWSVLQEALNNKRIVALGESLHGVKEYNQAKLEIIKYLHEEMGFNVIAIESDLMMNYYGNAFRDKIQDTLLLKHLITPVWHTSTHLELVRYIKENPKLKLVGFDILKVQSIEEVLDTLELNNDSIQLNSHQFVQHYNQVKTLYKNEEHFYDGNRDSIMAYNLEWILETLYPDEKIIISAANDHISKTSASKYGYMGELLSNKYKDQYYSIGFFHSLGNPTHLYRDVFYSNTEDKLPENSLQKKMLDYPGNHNFIDFEAIVNDSEYNWINQPLKHVLLSGKYEYEIDLINSFDAVFWLRSVTFPTYIIDSKYHWRHKK